MPTIVLIISLEWDISDLRIFPFGSPRVPVPKVWDTQVIASVVHE